MYEPRTYRHWVKGRDLISFSVVVRETDLYIRTTTNLKRKAHKLVVKYRGAVESYIERYPAFLTSLEPLAVGDDAPPIVRSMSEATQKVGVGPMASIAGAIAEFVGNDLLALSPEIILENGGDIYLKSLKKRLIGIYAGKSPLTGKIGLEINGHSLSYGKADAVVVLSKSATLADAAATSIGNLIAHPDDIPSGIEFAKGIEGLLGVIIIQDGKAGLWGEVKICQMARE